MTAVIFVSRKRAVTGASIFFAALVVIGWRLVVPNLSSWRDHTWSAALLVAPVAAAVLAVWRQANRGRELDVHDRAVDFTVVACLAGLALALTVLLVRRLGDLAPAMRVDALCLPLWVAAASVALFGIRATRRHLYSLAILGALWPLPFGAIGTVVPAPSLGWVAALSIAVVSAGGLLVGPGRRVALAVAGTVAAVLAVAHLGGNQVAVLAAASLLWPLARVLGLGLLPRPTLRTLLASAAPAPAVRRANPAIPIVVGLAVVASLTPAALLSSTLAPIRLAVAATGQVIPGSAPASSRAGTGPAAAPTGASCPVLGPGWVLVRRYRLGDRQRLGAFPTTRCRYRSGTDAPANTVAVDLSDPQPVELLSQFPYEATYRTIGSESPIQHQAKLADGQAVSLAYANPNLPLTTEAVTRLVDLAPHPSRSARRMVVIVTDDPRPGSPLPTIAPHLLDATLTRLESIIRVSPQAARRAETMPKNEELAWQLAALVVAQWDAI